MPKLSVVIITYNEEKNIGRCLASLEGIADEIVVLDSFSTDNTEYICKSYGAKFVQHKFDGHIQQKNRAISHASYPHVLSLDADEELSAKLKNSILQVKNNWKYDGYYFNRLTNYCGKWIRHTSWYPARKLRLWDSRKGSWGGINPHDKFIMQKGASTYFLKGDLLHYSYYSINEHINQVNKFSEITAKAYFEKGIRPGYFKILFNPLWRFIRDFFFRAGVLDGFYGMVICVNSAHETFLKYVKLRQLVKNEKKKNYKLCFFNTATTWGGGEKWHFDVATRLITKGHEVFIYTHPKSELRRKVKEYKIPIRLTRVSNLSFLNVFKIIEIALVLKKEEVKTIIINLSADFKVAGLAAKLVGIPNIIYRRGSAIPIRDTRLNRFLFQEVATK
ncbi:MAG: glycosyltransferase, partial [bacterium]